MAGGGRIRDREEGRSRALLVDETLLTDEVGPLGDAARSDLRLRLEAMGVWVLPDADDAEGDCEASVTLPSARALLVDGRVSVARINEALGAQTRCARRTLVRGLDDALLFGRQDLFEAIERACAGTVELDAGNALGSANALAAEWAMGGWGPARTTLFGIGGHAATEAVAACLATAGGCRRHDLAGIRVLADAWERAGLPGIAAHAPVAGTDLFAVESGIHVDGILKDPSNYEAFSPESVGARRRIVLGCRSGRAAVAHELARAGIEADDDLTARVLALVVCAAPSHGGHVPASLLGKLARQAQEDREAKWTRERGETWMREAHAG